MPKPSHAIRSTTSSARVSAVRRPVRRRHGRRRHRRRSPSGHLRRRDRMGRNAPFAGARATALMHVPLGSEDPERARAAGRRRRPGGGTRRGPRAAATSAGSDRDRPAPGGRSASRAVASAIARSPKTHGPHWAALWPAIQPMIRPSRGRRSDRCRGRRRRPPRTRCRPPAGRSGRAGGSSPLGRQPAAEVARRAGPPGDRLAGCRRRTARRSRRSSSRSRPRGPRRGPTPLIVTSALPGVVSRPISRYQPSPNRAISAAWARLSTFWTSVGRPSMPRSYGRGGVIVGRASAALTKWTAADSSPAT